MASTTISTPPNSIRALGILGIAGGVWIVAWLLPFIPWGPDGINLRIVTFNIGAMAVALAVYRRLTTTASGPARFVAVVALLANACYLVATLVSIGRPAPPAPDPDFRLAWFWVGVAMWWADAALGLVALRFGGLARWGGLALALGSVLAFLGMDRLELVAGPYEAIVVPLALAGITLNGVGWILLGVDVLTRPTERAAA